MRTFFFFLVSFAGFSYPMVAQCNSGPLTVISNTTITGSCVVNGDLIVENGAALNVDLSGTPADTFVVRGNIVVQGGGILWVHGSVSATNDQFIVSNITNNQRTITVNDSGRVQLAYVEFRTQEGNLSNAASFYMNYFGNGKSVFYTNKTWLNPQTAWLLCNLNHRSTFIGFEPDRMPTEIYLQDTAQLALHGPNANTGLWLNMQSVAGTLNLPADQTVAYTWNVGRGAGGIASQWYLEIDTANPGLGVQVFPSTQLTVYGTGLPATGELKVGMMFAMNTDTIRNLQAGLQNTTVADGPSGNITLHHVNLGPIAWQLYALMNESLFIKKSLINEIGIGGPSQIKVDSSVLQLGALAAVGAGGSLLTINNTQIWNQTITASNRGKVILNNCGVTGSAFSTTDTTSHITVNGGCFYQNPAGCTPNTMVNITTGQPYCNPFIPAGFPKNLTPATVAFVGVNNNCTAGIPEAESKVAIHVYPNPCQDFVCIESSNSMQFTVTLYSILGKEIFRKENRSMLDLSRLPTGIYLLKVSEAIIRKY
jgi:hypothetical protein